MGQPLSSLLFVSVVVLCLLGSLAAGRAAYVLAQACCGSAYYITLHNITLQAFNASASHASPPATRHLFLLLLPVADPSVAAAIHTCACACRLVRVGEEAATAAQHAAAALEAKQAAEDAAEVARGECAGMRDSLAGMAAAEAKLKRQLVETQAREQIPFSQGLSVCVLSVCELPVCACCVSSSAHAPRCTACCPAFRLGVLKQVQLSM